MAITQNKKTPLFASILVALSMPFYANATDLSEPKLDQFVSDAMAEFNIPGISVGVIKDGNIKHLKGYGIREVGKEDKITPDTMFAIASNSKAFTAAGLAILTDDGVLHWDDKVIDYIPNFRLADPWVTREFTIRDLLTHRSGMGLGAGDLMFWPTTEVNREEIIHNVRHLKMVSGFRTEYAYDNLLYVIAGEVIAAASGMSYEEFIQTRIINKLGIQDSCRADLTTLKHGDNIAEPHAYVGGKITKVKRLQELGEPMIISAAGGLQCSAEAMMTWVKTHLNDGGGLLSAEQHKEMWTPQTIMRVSNRNKEWHKTNFAAYGLGFRLNDHHGRLLVSHTGGLAGMVTYTVMVPDEDLGIVVLTNQENGSAMRAIMFNILQTYLDTGDVDWTKRLSDLRKEQQRAAQAVIDAEGVDADASSLLTEEEYMGTYRDPWFGDVNISKKDGGLYFTASKSRRLKGKVLPFKFNTFKVIWDDRSFNADAYAMFEMDFEGKINGLKMKAISPLTDFSFDFHDLDFDKIN